MRNLLIAMLVTLALPVQAERIKDLASIEGVRGNPLVGYGLVVGLDGTGDQTTQAPFTTQGHRRRHCPGQWHRPARRRP